MAAGFSDRRAPEQIEHSVGTRFGRRIFGPVLGYGEPIDRDRLRYDPQLGACLDKLEGRRKGCAARAGKSTQSRLERARGRRQAPPQERPGCDGEPARRPVPRRPCAGAREIVLDLDLDAADVALHGEPEGRFRHGHSGRDCSPPLHVVCGERRFSARQRRASSGRIRLALLKIGAQVTALRANQPSAA